MTTTQPPICEQVRMAALARLDGEPPGMPSDTIDAHIADCGACQAALAGLTSLHRDLGRVDYERLDADLWPALQRHLAADVPHRAWPEGRTILGLTIVLVAWRVAQLVLDVPAPVVNAVVPLALIVVVLRRLTGDPFAIRLSSPQPQQKGAS